LPILSNPRHERFAQGLAAGKSAEEAYSEAGFKPSRSNASTLRQNQNVLERVSELLVEREAIHAQATAQAIKATGLTKEWVIETLMENVARSMQAKPAKVDDDGNAVGEYQYQGSVTNRALELLGKELGMFVERSEVKVSDFEELTVEQKRERILGRVKELGVDRIGTPAGTA
jgi:phage terminase small subunit